MISNVGKWSGWRDDAPIQLGPIDSYRRLVAWLDGHGDIADWGGGTGFARQFVTVGPYRVVDGSQSRENTELVDLATCDVHSDGIMMRHVLEHNHHWPDVLANLLAHFRVRAAIAIGMPLVDGPTELDHEEATFLGSVGLGVVPVLRLSRPELMAQITPFVVHTEHPGFGSPDVPDETIFYLSKEAR